jgi:mRNA interferase MazF
MAGVHQRRRPAPEVVRRGDIWLAALDPTVGSEIRKSRPCVVVSPPEMHDHLRTVIVAPMTTGSRPAPFRVGIRFQGKSGLILLDQIRTLDQARLVKRLGTARPATLAALLQTLQDVFAP